MFTVRHHAILYAFIARSVIQAIGKDKGEPIIEEAVKIYGLQRGNRMALRAIEDGHKLTMDTFLAYGEWEADSDEIELNTEQHGSDFKTIITKCPWYETWKEYELLDYGKHYCSNIDAALVEGFNPDLKMKIDSTQTNGGEQCDFLFSNANPANTKIIPVQKTIMPWEYHTGHLFKTFSIVIKKWTKSDGEKIMKMALKDFYAFFSKEFGDKVEDYIDTNFETPPQPK